MFSYFKLESPSPTSNLENLFNSSDNLNINAPFNFCYHSNNDSQSSSFTSFTCQPIANPSNIDSGSELSMMSKWSLDEAETTISWSSAAIATLQTASFETHSRSSLLKPLGQVQKISSSKATSGEVKKKQRRIRFREKQLEYLENEFGQCQYPTAEMREQFAIKLGVNLHIIDIWFQNRRAKLKKHPQQNITYNFIDIPN